MDRVSLIAGVLLLAGAAAQSPEAKPVTIAIRYTPGSTLYFASTIHSKVNGQPMTDTAAEVAIHILSSAGPDDYLAEAHFTKYAVAATATVPALRAEAESEAAKESQESLALPPVRFHLLRNQVTLVTPPQQPESEAAENLEAFLRNDDLPPAPESVGDHWQSTQNYPAGIGGVSLATTLDCTLIQVGEYQGEPAATIEVHSQGSSQLPAAALPGLSELVAQGAKVAVQLAAEGTFTVQHRLSDGISVMSTAVEHEHLHVVVTGPDGQPHAQDTEVVDEETVSLERIVPPPAPAGGDMEWGGDLAPTCGATRALPPMVWRGAISAGSLLSV